MDTTDYNYGQSSKNGNVVKCPSCGAPVKVGSLVCPECGHEFRNVKANATVTKFTEELNSLRRAGGAMGFVLDAVGDTRRVAFIEDYPIPDSLDDVLELMLLAKSNADKDGLPEQRAYWTMFCRCVDKVKNSGMQNDPRFAPLLEFYKKNAKKKNVGGMVTAVFLPLVRNRICLLAGIRNIQPVKIGRQHKTGDNGTARLSVDGNRWSAGTYQRQLFGVCLSYNKALMASC